MKRQALLTLKIFGILMVMFVIPFGCINGRFDNTVGHTNAQDGESVPETTHENHMAHIPDPFKTKWKHK
jgi:hypothetical protein